ncbi:hypothetical protein FY036_21505 [Mesorhizobium microcysteis]|jgi:membrane-bound acyltransferase YfiQ involved in biofilm formation|uniref:Cbb3-type cytochrome c oxidase subunit I n=1 Tax=Neoaquamicrobium microcysteis TaxID=2682781 RepID=A0A5D4GSA4_9HYPH|nr:OpgC domain-containing protein [Mesorhizobium microcysteis]TYR29450.1 hypothetical protein FY036_21505 [Mesorhizobium microcysteis]
MTNISNYYFKTAIVFLIVGIMVGLHMSITHSYAPAGAHAHINLLGWVTMFLFGVYLALHPSKGATRLARIQYFVYTIGVAVMTPSLYMLLSGRTELEPLVAISSLVTFAGVLLFAVIIFRREA